MKPEQAPVRDRGSGDALAFVLIFPALVAVALLVVSIGRQVETQTVVRTAAESGAQAAALERDRSVGSSRAKEVVEETLDGASTCESRTVTTTYDVDVGGEIVKVTVRCGVQDQGLERLATDFDADIPAQYEVTAVATLDQYRSG